MNSEIIAVGSRTLLKPKEIVCLEADSNYTIVHLNSGKRMVISYHLGLLHKRLIETGLFVRPNRNQVLNMQHIKSVNQDFLQLHFLELKIAFSRRRKEKSINQIISFNPKMNFA